MHPFDPRAPSLYAVQAMIELAPSAVYTLLVVCGLALAFAGYRIFQVCLGILGFVAGVTLGFRLAAQTHVVGMARWLIVVGAGLLGSVAASAIYHVGVFLLGGLALAGAAGAAGVGIEHPLGPWVLLGAGLVGGALAVALHRRLLIYATALVGALLAVAGLAPLVSHASPPDAITVAWLQQQALALPRWWLAVAFGVFLLGSLAQLVSQHRRFGRQLLAASRVDPALGRPAGGHSAGGRSGRRDGSPRTHGAICPRCSAVVDVDALFCPACGNDRWDV